MVPKVITTPESAAKTEDFCSQVTWQQRYALIVFGCTNLPDEGLDNEHTNPTAVFPGMEGDNIIFRNLNISEDENLEIN